MSTLSTVSTISTLSTISTVCIYIILYCLSRYDPLLDSSNMTMDDWIQIAKDIRESYANFDGCVSILQYLQSTLSTIYTM